MFVDTVESPCRPGLCWPSLLDVKDGRNVRPTGVAVCERVCFRVTHISGTARRHLMSVTLLDTVNYS